MTGTRFKFVEKLRKFVSAAFTLLTAIALIVALAAPQEAEARSKKKQSHSQVHRKKGKQAAWKKKHGKRGLASTKKKAKAKRKGKKKRHASSTLDSGTSSDMGGEVRF